jgi:hypothetical protein
MNIRTYEKGYMFLHEESERERLDLVGAPCDERGKGRDMDRAREARLVGPPHVHMK